MDAQKFYKLTSILPEINVKKKENYLKILLCKKDMLLEMSSFGLTSAQLKYLFYLRVCTKLPKHYTYKSLLFFIYMKGLS